MIKVILLLASLALALSARADIIVFDTLGPPGDVYNNGVGLGVGSFLGGPVYEEAAPFDARVDGILATVQLALTWETSPPTRVNVFLYSDVNGLPDNNNQIFLGSATPTTQFGNSFPTFPLLTIAISGNVSVARGFSYWLVVKPVAPIGDDVWNTSTMTSGSLPYGSTDDSTWVRAQIGPAAFRITAVPEPSVCVLAALGLILCAQHLRRKQGRLFPEGNHEKDIAHHEKAFL